MRPIRAVWVLLWMIVFHANHTMASEKYWVSFTDKKNVSFDPQSYFDPRAITQRQAAGIPVFDSTDAPVSEIYIQRILCFTDSLSWASRWLNGIAVYSDESRIQCISSEPFVRSVEPMTSKTISCTTEPGVRSTVKTQRVISLLHYQTDRSQAEIFRKKNLDGKGIRIAVLDAGFPDVNTSTAFTHIRARNGFIATYDFVGKKENVYHGHWHGEATLSCIAGIYDSIPIGMATGAEFCLALTERNAVEVFSEEENWLAAAEWADRLGVNIISSSLGYTEKRYFNTDMDGRKSLVAQAAAMAARKGILIVNAAGNEGGESWRFVDTPGDADSILTVGGTDPGSDSHIYFSSYGPTHDGRLKPNVCAPGETAVMFANKLTIRYGTSFSAPLVAGFAACAWQAKRNSSCIELLHNIEKSGSLYPYFDYAHGYGIPQAGKVLNEWTEPEPTFNFVIVNNDIKVVLSERFSYSAEEASLGYAAQRNLFYKIEDRQGKMRSYTVIIAQEKEALNFQASDFAPGDVITVHFEGYTRSLNINDISQ